MALAALLPPAALICAAHPAVEAPRGYLSELQQPLQALAEKHKGSAQLKVIGRSAGGRDIWALRIAGPGALPPEKRPALWVGANIEGPRMSATRTALRLAEQLLAGAQADRTWYILPCLNPDGFDASLKGPRFPRPWNDQKLDRDADGLIAEDGVDDLDADGVIRQLRVADPLGEWIVDPEEPRQMIRAAAGQPGTHRVYTEGRDDDGDGLFNEDGVGGVRLDRSFPYLFPSGDPEAGPWSSWAPETKAIMDHVVGLPNLSLAILLGAHNNLGARPGSPMASPAMAPRTVEAAPGRPGRAGGGGNRGSQAPTRTEAPAMANLRSMMSSSGMTMPMEAFPQDEGLPTKVEAEDQKALEPLATEYRKAMEAAKIDLRGGTEPGAGSLHHWLYFTLGLPVVELEAWAPPRAGKTAAADLLSLVDKEQPSAFGAWKPVKLGKLKAEVGGLDPMFILDPPQKLLEAQMLATTKVIQGFATALPGLDFQSLEATALGAGVYRIQALGRATGTLPTHTVAASKARNRMPVRLELETKGLSFLAPYRAVTAERLDKGQTIRAEWMVQAKPGTKLDVVLRSEHLGTQRRTLTLSKED